MRRFRRDDRVGPSAGKSWGHVVGRAVPLSRARRTVAGSLVGGAVLSLLLACAAMKGLWGRARTQTGDAGA